MSPWKDSVFSVSTISEFIKNYIDSDTSVIFLHDKGIIGGQLVPLFFGKGVIANEVFWFAESHGKILLNAFEEWGKAMGAEKILLSSLAFGNERDMKMTKYYDKLGYKPIEIHFAKGVP